MKDTIYSRFHSLSSAHAERVAIITDKNKYTYRDLAIMTDKIVHLFPKSSPRRVGIMMRHSPQMIASILATLKMGVAYVPVEPSFPPERVKYIMEQANVDFIITDHAYDSLPKDRNLLKIGKVIIPSNYNITPSRPQMPNSEAYILYTSGTTGRPKGVVIENRNVTHYARAFKHEFDIRPGDIMLQYSVCTFDIFTEEVMTPLLNGAAIAIPPEDVHGDIEKLMQFVRRHNVTIISGFPYLILDINKRAELLPECVRLLISGGDVLRASYIDNIKDKVEIYNTYGPSETTVCASYQRCDNIDPLPDGTYPIGHPVAGAQIIILDENLSPVKKGEVGEICILGNGVGKGYLAECPESKNFIDLPSGARLYRSGDLGFSLPDGSFAFLHRKDKQVMIMGKRVECDEVQNVIANNPDVESTVVVPRTDSKGLSYLVAYVVPKALQSFSLDKLKDSMKKYLTSFMIPEFFVTLATLPLTPNGKPDIAALPVIAKS